MENKVIIVDRGNYNHEVKILRLLMMSIIPIAVLAFIDEAFQPELLSLILISIIVSVVLVSVFFVFSLLGPYWYIATKIEYNKEELIVHRSNGKVKFRFDEKPVKIGKLFLPNYLGYMLIGIRRPGLSFTNVMIPDKAKNIDEIIALFKRIGNQ